MLKCYDTGYIRVFFSDTYRYGTCVHVRIIERLIKVRIIEVVLYVSYFCSS